MSAMRKNGKVLWRFVPLPDITAYELALCMPALTRIDNHIRAEVTRHFVEVSGE